MSRSTCKDCVWYVPGWLNGRKVENGECRANPPTRDGFPVIHENKWCRQLTTRAE